MGEVLGAYVEAGDYLFLKYVASVAPSVMAGFIEVEDRHGRVQPYEVEVKTFTLDRTLQENEDQAVEIQQDGKIVGGGIRRNADALRRGQCFAILDVQRRRGADLLVSKGYVYSINPIGLGEFTEAAGGMGNRFWNAVAADVSPVDIIKTLATTNARRIIHGFIWYYHASGDVATRVMEAQLRNIGPDLPTGMSPGGRTMVWTSGSISMTQNEEGMIYSYAEGGRDGRSILNDTGVIGVDNTGTKPTPWPLSVIETDDAELRFSLTNEEAADRHSIYLDIEEWMSF